MAAKITEAQLWAEILAACTLARREPGEKTIYEIAEETKSLVETVRPKIQKLCRSGKMTCRKVLIEGKLTNVYRPKA